MVENVFEDRPLVMHSVSYAVTSEVASVKE
jgi:hypothetical protein